MSSCKSASCTAGLPANWLGYPGSRVLGGTPIGSGISGDRCVALCQVHASCYSIDFNSIDGSCWAHTSELVKCGAPIPTNYIYHVKKPTACGQLIDWTALFIIVVYMAQGRYIIHHIWLTILAKKVIQCCAWCRWAILSTLRALLF